MCKLRIDALVHIPTMSYTLPTVSFTALPCVIIIVNYLQAPENTSSQLSVFTVKSSGSFHHENIPINFDPLKPHFQIVKLGFTGVYIIFLFLVKNIDCWVLVRTDSVRRF